MKFEGTLFATRPHGTRLSSSLLAAPGRLAFAITWRSAVIGVLSYVLVELLSETHLYATALVLFAAVASLARSLAYAVMRVGALHQSRVALSENAADAHSIHPQRILSEPMDSAQSVEQQVELDYVHALLDTVGAALVVIDQQGRVELCNRAAHRLAGGFVHRLDEIPAIGSDAAERIASLTMGAQRVIRLADGNDVHVSCTEFRVPNQAARRLLALQRIHGDLDVVELKAWHDMARVISHEMMNSLTPIASLSESLGLLAQQAKDGNSAHGELEAAIEAIRRRSLSLLSFVERYRSVTHLPPPAPRIVPIQPFFAGIEHFLAPTFKDRRVDFRYSCSPEHLKLLVDPELLEQALINLLHNSVEASEQTPDPSIELRCCQQSQTVVISVTDNGRGVPRNEQGHLLTPFFTTKRGSIGTGLTVARHAALAHGGQLNVGDNAPNGAIVTLVFPNKIISDQDCGQ